MKKEKQELSEQEQPKRKKGMIGPQVFVSYAFVLLFLSLIIYMGYFQLRARDAVLASPYNKRQDALATHVVRGDIVSSDGQLLATTVVHEDKTESRSYPYGRVFAHSIGYDANGKAGLETIANYDLLQSHGNVIDTLVNEFQEEKNPGDTVVTSLSAALQQTAYDALGDRRGAVLLMNVKTGQLLVMLSKPDFDPNTIREDWEAIVGDESNSQLLNRATQGLYPPGSTFKIVTALSYLRANGSVEDFSYTCTGELPLDDYTVHCYHGTAHGEVDLTGAFAKSCNCAFAQLALDLGAQSIKDAASSCMIGANLPSVLPYSKSRMSLTTEDDDAQLARTAFGQGATVVTPWQMLLLTAAIANDGVLMEPVLVDRVENKNGQLVSETLPRTNRQVFGKTEVSALQELMRAVVTDGTGQAFAESTYGMAGKTGSAEYLRSDGSMGTHAWFIGYSHPEDPELAVCVLVEDGASGSETAVPLAKQLMDRYYG